MGVWDGFLSQVVTKLAPGIRVDDPSTNAIFQWVARMQEHALGKWKSFASTGLPCALPRFYGSVASPCPNPPASHCELCHEPVCLEHAAVAVNGSVVCVRCITDLVRERIRARGGRGAPGDAHSHGPAGQGPPPPAQKTEAELRKGHLATLGLKEPADWEEINGAFRELAKKYHPDKQTAPKKKETAAAKFKAISEAHQWLSANTARA